MRLRVALTGLALWVLLVTPLRAHEGHDHGADPIATTATRSLPRVEASSELFELVGVVEGRRITVFLDRFADNAPVENAKIELESGALKLVATPGEDQTYLIELPALLAAGDHPMTFTVAAGKDTDLLTGTLHWDAPGEVKSSDSHGHAYSHAGELRAMLGYAGWIVAALLAIAMFRKARTRRSERSL